MGSERRGGQQEGGLLGAPAAIAADLPSAFDRVPGLTGAPRTVTELPGGLTNRNYKVSTPQGSFVVRVWSAESILTRPKSTSLMVPLGVSLMLPGLMSRCRTEGS